MREFSDSAGDLTRRGTAAIGALKGPPHGEQRRDHDAATGGSADKAAEHVKSSEDFQTDRGPHEGDQEIERPVSISSPRLLNHSLGSPIDPFTPIFSASRMSAQIAHILEQ